VEWTTVRRSLHVARGRRDGRPLRGEGGQKCTVRWRSSTARVPARSRPAAPRL